MSNHDYDGCHDQACDLCAAYAAGKDKARGELGIPLPRTPQKQINEAIRHWLEGGYGSSGTESFDSFMGGVAVAISMVEGGKQWMEGPTTEFVHKALRLLLANVGSGGIGQAHMIGYGRAEAYVIPRPRGTKGTPGAPLLHTAGPPAGGLLLRRPLRAHRGD